MPGNHRQRIHTEVKSFCRSLQDEQAAAELLRTLSNGGPKAPFGSPMEIPTHDTASQGALLYPSPTHEPQPKTSQGIARALNLIPSSRLRSQKSPLWVTDSSLHPLLRLGWKPICRVICNGLTGEFLGGHDRDLYIRCTSPEYKDKPNIDVSAGGCIMSCSQFERAAGRELSKKWKESIHVVAQVDGTKSTLIAWLKRLAEEMYGDRIIGHAVWVCWPADAEWYQGTIIAYSRETGKHTVRYSATLGEQLHLPAEQISFDQLKPFLAPLSPSTVDQSNRCASEVGFTFAPVLSAGRLVDAMDEQHTYSPHGSGGLWHQNSNMSGNDSGDKFFHTKSNVLTAVEEEDQGRGSGGDPHPHHHHHPKRARSAPASVLLSAALMSEALAVAASNEKKKSELALALTEVVAAPAPPPSSRLLESDRTRMSRWLHQLALDLDVDLETYKNNDAVFDIPIQSYSGMFQGVVALHEEQMLMGLYEGAVLRYGHFENAGSISVLRKKMVEFIVGVCQSRQTKNETVLFART